MIESLALPVPPDDDDPPPGSLDARYRRHADLVAAIDEQDEARALASRGSRGAAGPVTEKAAPAVTENGLPTGHVPA
jgi:hypothetical protein